MNEELLLTEAINTDDMLFGSDLDQDGEPRHVQTEPFEIADDLSSSMAQEKLEDHDPDENIKFISD